MSKLIHVQKCELRMHFSCAGKNNGRGFYIYEKGSRPKPDPSVLPILEESRRIANIMPDGKVLKNVIAEAICINVNTQFA